MLESISARGWGRASFVVACIAVVVIGYVYGSELRGVWPQSLAIRSAPPVARPSSRLGAL